MFEISFSIANGMTAAERFYKYFNCEYGSGCKSLSFKNEFIAEFITHTPEVINELETNLIKHEINDFYIKIKNLKYLCEYSEEFNRYWLLLRSVSGGLKRLLDDPSRQNATNAYIYYYSNYGGRRKLRDESWFESNRWEFLDKLAGVTTDEELNDFILEKIASLTSYFQLYKEEVERLIIDLEKLIQ